MKDSVLTVFIPVLFLLARSVGSPGLAPDADSRQAVPTGSPITPLLDAPTSRGRYACSTFAGKPNSNNVVLIRVSFGLRLCMLPR